MDRAGYALFASPDPDEVEDDDDDDDEEESEEELRDSDLGDSAFVSEGFSFLAALLEARLSVL
jgi:hypothetical protein